MKKLTIGQERVAANKLSDGQLAKIDQVKGVVAALIDNLQFIVDEGGSKARAACVAQERFEEGQMWAVRAIAKPKTR